MKLCHRHASSTSVSPQSQRVTRSSVTSLRVSCTSAVMMAALLLPAFANAASKAPASTAALRIACEDADAGAEVYVNDKFKGECPVDIMLPEGAYKIRVIKKIDASHERKFEQELRLAEGTAKKISVSLGASDLSAEGRRLAEKATKERRAAMEDELRKLIRAAKAGDADAKAVLARRYIADAKGCLVWNPNPQEDESVTWSGPCRDGMASGKGELQWFKKEVKGSQYVGDMAAGKHDGKGATQESMGRYDGDWEAGRKNGYGTMIYGDNSRYEGQWVEGRRSGSGRLFFPNGARYEGNWADHFMNGYGVYSWPGGERYEGNFVAGKRTGRGVVIFPDGTREEGQYLNDVLKN